MVLGLCMCNFLVEDSREDSKHQHQGALYLTPQRIIFSLLRLQVQFCTVSKNSSSRKINQILRCV